MPKVSLEWRGALRCRELHDDNVATAREVFGGIGRAEVAVAGIGSRTVWEVAGDYSSIPEVHNYRRIRFPAGSDVGTPLASRSRSPSPYGRTYSPEGRSYSRSPARFYRSPPSSPPVSPRDGPFYGTPRQHHQEVTLPLEQHHHFQQSPPGYYPEPTGYHHQGTPPHHTPPSPPREDLPPPPQTAVAARTAEAPPPAPPAQADRAPTAEVVVVRSHNSPSPPAAPAAGGGRGEGEGKGKVQGSPKGKGKAGQVSTTNYDAKHPGPAEWQLALILVVMTVVWWFTGSYFEIMSYTLKTD